MADALTLHMEHEETLQKSTGQLEMSNRQLVAEKELTQQLVKEKIRQSRKQKKQMKELEVRSPNYYTSCDMHVMYMYVAYMHVTYIYVTYMHGVQEKSC